MGRVPDCGRVKVYALNPKSVARYRERHSTSGAKSDAADAHLLAEIVRLDRAAHRPVPGDTALAEGIKLAARSHQNLVWERTRHVLRLRSALREFYPAAVTAFPELDAPDALELLGKAPDPDTGARLSRRTIAAAYARANRRDPAGRAEKTWRILRADELRQPGPIQAAFAAITSSEAAIIAALTEQIEVLGKVVADHFGQHPAAEILTSTPGLGVILSARLLGEFGDDPDRYVDAKARKAYAGSAQVTKAQAPERSFWPAAPATNASVTQRTSGRFPRCADPPARRRTTSNSEHEAPVIGQPYANYRTDGSASSTAASRPAPPTTNTPPGPTFSSGRLDSDRTRDVCRIPRGRTGASFRRLADAWI
jgi:transposase